MAPVDMTALAQLRLTNADLDLYFDYVEVAR
jgi:hypothetical protein